MGRVCGGVLIDRDLADGRDVHRSWAFGRSCFARRDEVGDFRVIDVPGHSRGHIALFRDSDRVLILGDVLNSADPLTGVRASCQSSSGGSADVARGSEGSMSALGSSCGTLHREARRRFASDCTRSAKGAARPVNTVQGWSSRVVIGHVSAQAACYWMIPNGFSSPGFRVARTAVA
jgi:hypothetical protein